MLTDSPSAWISSPIEVQTAATAVSLKLGWVGDAARSADSGSVSDGRRAASRSAWRALSAAGARFSLKRVNETLGHRDLATITPADIQKLVGELSTDLKPATVRRYLAMLRSLLDYTGLEPSPARDRTVKLPPLVKEELKPPAAQEFLAILDAHRPGCGWRWSFWSRPGSAPASWNHRSGTTSTPPTSGSGSQASTPKPGEHGGWTSPNGSSTRSNRPAHPGTA